MLSAGSSAAPSGNSQTFLSMVGLSLDSSEGLIFNITVLDSSLLMGFCVFSGFLNGTGGRYMGACPWFLSSLGIFPSFTFLWGVNSLAVPYVYRIKKIEVLMKIIN